MNEEKLLQTSSSITEELLEGKSESDIESQASESSPQTPVPSGSSHAIQDISKQLDNARDALSSKEHHPMRLLDLPVDVLKEIVKELTHTNDLAALALTHSALHKLAVPHIYSRFDIVWPDTHATADPRTGVDALTYGLATLVMGEEMFTDRHTHIQTSSHKCSQCGHVDNADPTSLQVPFQPTRRYGNNFAQFTRKFSLGNGPPDWVSEYMINKESGKMLGTLVALAIARMPFLETFVWDMPTGVLRDVWLALASIAERHGGQNCRLERVWVRWHDNRDSLHLVSQTPLAPGNQGFTAASAALFSNSTQTGIPTVVPPGVPAVAPTTIPTGPHIIISPSVPHLQVQSRVEYPTFSVLPPLKSLSVLDIDELAYIKEMSILIGRSKNKLRELRVGIAKHAVDTVWAKASEPVQMGVLGLLTSELDFPGGINISSGHRERNNQSVQKDMVEAVEKPSVSESISTESGTDVNSLHQMPSTVLRTLPVHNRTPKEKLRLEILELERTTLSVPVLQRVIDWSLLTTLTILHCPNHEHLWKALRHTFAPRSSASQKPPSLQDSPARLGYSIFNRSRPPRPMRSEYKLNLKRIHTNMVSNSLITFLKDALAPDSLEWLFLQESRLYPSPVTIDAIFKGAIKKHRGSLKRLMVDSSERMDNGQLAANEKWKKWMFPRDLLKFITSGSMGNLRELGMALDYRDWHFFLQSLPRIKHIRSLYIPFLSSHVGNMDARELAMQVLDTVSLRPEIELCYVGLRTKCFEILEGKPGDGRDGYDDPMNLDHGSTGAGDSDGESDDEETDDDDDGDTGTVPAGDPFDSQSDTSSNPYASSEDGSVLDERFEPKLRLREILFYDDKVSVFKVRHGRL
ncbi:MAG: hypothetical protein M1834_006129 [Cirrosporium novae-zelandiae]|nr:MAG: hypothetical protein M1834_006129 [Cirrosporium novae-zelandiae]